MARRSTTIMDPTAKPSIRLSGLPKPVKRLRGAVVVVLTNRWQSMDLIAERFAQRLPSQHGVADVLIRAIPVAGPASEAVLDEVAARAQLAVVGLAN